MPAKNVVGSYCPLCDSVSIFRTEFFDDERKKLLVVTVYRILIKGSFHEVYNARVEEKNE